MDSSAINQRIKVNVSHDETRAMILFVPGEDTTFTVSQVLLALSEAGVIHGITDEKIAIAIESKRFNQWFTVAIYTPPTDGIDANVEHFISEDFSHKKLEDGGVDYYSLEKFKDIVQGQPLLKKIPATEGIEGMSITGKKLPAQSGHDLNFKDFVGGEGVIIDDRDPNLIISTVDGVYSRIGDPINVKEFITINHDIDYEVGNIKTLAGVRINGDIKSGFEVMSERDILVSGVIENARTKARGNIEVLKGIVKGNTEVSAEEKIIANYISGRSPVKAKEIIIKNMIVGSFLYAADAVTARKIVGGKVITGGRLEVFELGNKTGNFTRVEAGINPAFLLRHRQLTQEIDVLKKDKRRLLETRVEAEYNYEGTEEKLETLHFRKKHHTSEQISSRLEKRLKIYSKEIENINTEMKAMDERFESAQNELNTITPTEGIKDPEIIVRGTIHPNVSIKMGLHSEIHTMKEKKNIRFYLGDDGNIKAASNY